MSNLIKLEQLEASLIEAKKYISSLKYAGSSSTGGKANSAKLADEATTLTGLTSTVTELNYVDGVTSKIQTQLNGKVPTTRTINNKALTANITLSAADIGADISGAASDALNAAKTYTNEKFNAIVGEGASEALDTIGEISTALKGNADIIDTLNASIGNKVNKTTQTATVLGVSKTTEKIGNNQLVFPNGGIFSGSAQNAGLVTKGICGVTTPSATGACEKDNLYINYDGENTYNTGRHMILQAGTVGTHYGNNLYQYAVPRGDIVKAWVEAKGYITSAALPTNYIKSGSQTTTSTADGGSNVYTFPNADGTTSTFTVKNGSKGSTGSKGDTGATGTAAGFGTPTATIDSNVGTPSVTVTASGGNTSKVFNFAFKNLKGATGATGPQGPKGDTGATGNTGAAAGFGTPTASVDNNVGTPSVTITSSGANTAKVFNFAFKNLKGATGAQGPKGDTGNTGTTGEKGEKGDTGNGFFATASVASNGTITGVSTIAKVNDYVVDGNGNVYKISGTTVAEGTYVVGSALFNIKGPQGSTGAAAGFGTPTATVDANIGTPSVTVTTSGSNTSKVFNFAFKNLKGQKGDTGSAGAKGDTGATGPQGPTGATGARGVSFFAGGTYSSGGYCTIPDFVKNNAQVNDYLLCTDGKVYQIEQVMAATGMVKVNTTAVMDMVTPVLAAIPNGDEVAY